MRNELLIALLSLAGTLLGTLGGILASARLTNYRLKALEEKVKAHNSLALRMIKVEQSAKSAHRRIDTLEKI